MNKAKKPEIRFKGFSDKWKKYKLGEVTTSYSGGTPAVGITEYYNGRIPFIRSAEVNRNYTELFITQKGLDNSSAKLVSKGDILYALYGATSGEVGRARLNGAINQAILAIKPLIGYDPEYLTQWLRKSKRNIIETYLQGGQGNLSGAIVKKLAIDFPSYEEQQVIGIYLQKFDEAIMRRQSKLEKLQAVKTSMLEKMFPKDGADVPEVRLRGYSGAWERRKLSDITERVVRKNYNNESSLPLTISAQYGLVDQTTYFNKRIASRDVSNYYLVLKGEFAYNKSTSDSFPFGAVKRLDLYEKGVLSTLYVVFGIKNQNETNSNYLAVFFDTDRWHKGVAERAAEGARNHGLLNISADDFLDIDLLLPRTEREQAAIGKYFCNLDHLISLQRQELDKLQSIKKALLEKMFV